MDFIFLWILAVVVGFWIFRKINQWKGLAPGPWGLPIVGYLPYINRHHPHLTLTKLAKQFGPIYSLQMGSIYAVILSDHKLIREAFSKEMFSGRAPLQLTHGIMKGNGIICAEGALWKDQRKLVTTWLKNLGMTKHGVFRDKLVKRISNETQELIQLIGESRGPSLDLSIMITNSLANIVNEIVFGFKYPLGDKTWKWFKQIQEEACHEMGVAGIVNFLPFIRLISPSTQKTIQMIVHGQGQAHRIYASIVATRRKMRGLEKPLGAEYKEHANLFNEHPEGFVKCFQYSKQNTDSEFHYFDPNTLIPSKDECILDSFLNEQKKRYENGDENARFVSDEQMLYLLADMFGAGLDTTYCMISWHILYMALYPEEQEKVRTEILTVYPDECEVDTTKLPYLMATICETQRIRSIVPVGIPHGCLHETFLGNYRIPKETMVIPLQWAIHMNPDVWEDPEHYMPSRFIDEHGELLKPQEFIPFQTGKRMCPGDELAKMLSSGIVYSLYRKFRIRLSSDPPTREEMKGEIGLVLTPPKVLYICEPVN